ncbi:MAG TPA: hypothetical protein V6C46_02895 [Coleofasciculaceae cyanobacterium]
MNNQMQLEPIVQNVGEAVLATTETVERLAERIDALVNQVQQQGYQIFALSDALETLTEAHQQSIQRLDRLTDVLQQLVDAIEQPPD